MKRLIGVIGLVAALFGVGCGSGSNSVPQTTPTPGGGQTTGTTSGTNGGNTTSSATAGQTTGTTTGQTPGTTTDQTPGTTLATINVPNTPSLLAVNPRTHKIYVLSQPRDNPTMAATLAAVVIDGSTNMMTTTIPLIPNHGDNLTPAFVLINPTTNRIYGGGVSGIDVPFGLAVSINDATDTVDPNGGFNFSGGADINSSTNTVYEGSYSNNGPIAVRDLTNTSAFTSIPLSNTTQGMYLQAVAVDSTRNRIYVANKDGLTVIDGNSKMVVGSVPVPESFLAGALVSVNPATNRIYLTTDRGVLNVIDGNTLQVIDTVPNFNGPLAVDTTSNHIYGYTLTGIAVLDGATDKVTPFFSVSFSGGNSVGGLAVAPGTKRVYISNPKTNTVTVLAGV